MKMRKRKREEEKEEEKRKEEDEESRGGPQSMTPDERRQEARRRNTFRRDNIAKPKKKKWCNCCLEDKTFDNYRFHPSCIFNLTPVCLTCECAGRRVKWRVQHSTKHVVVKEKEEEEEEGTGSNSSRMTVKEATRRNQERRATKVEAKQKWCAGCFVDKPLADYDVVGRGLFGIKRSCKQCCRVAGRREMGDSDERPLDAKEEYTLDEGVEEDVEHRIFDDHDPIQEVPPFLCLSLDFGLSSIIVCIPQIKDLALKRNLELKKTKGKSSASKW
jgi:hypothetical protein